ncbi:unnamed protein product [Effrenium voratum]|nr:unnamed protein product [Effrenium voratum]
MTVAYDGQLFKYSVFLVLCNRLAAVAFALVMAKMKGESMANEAPLWKYLIVSLSNVYASSCQYEALKYVSFAVQMLGKSFKMMPVMIWGMIIAGKSYGMRDWTVAFAVTLGCTEFLMTGPTHSKVDSANSFKGFLLLGGFLALDGLTSTFQEKLFKEHKTTKYNQMLYINLLSATVSIITLLATGDLAPALAFGMEHPQFWLDSALLSCSAVASQFFIYSQIKEFGALVFAATMNVRQVVSILVSYAKYSNPVTMLQILGLMVIFSALFYKSIASMMEAPKENAKEKEPILNKEEAAPLQDEADKRSDAEKKRAMPRCRDAAMPRCPSLPVVLTHGQAIIHDIIQDKMQRVQELISRVQRQEACKQEQLLIQAQQAEEEEQQLEAQRQDRARRSAEAFAVFAAEAAAAAQKRRAEEAALVRRMRQEEAEKKEKAKEAEEVRRRQRDHRLAQAQQRRHAADQAARARRALLKSAHKAAQEAVREAAKQKAAQKASARPVLDGATAARQQGLQRFAASLDAAHSHYAKGARPKSGALRRTASAPNRRPTSASCVVCGAEVKLAKPREEYSVSAVDLPRDGETLRPQLIHAVPSSGLGSGPLVQPTTSGGRPSLKGLQFASGESLPFDGSPTNTLPGSPTGLMMFPQYLRAVKLGGFQNDGLNALYVERPSEAFRVNDRETYWPASGYYFIYRSRSTSTWGIGKAKRFDAIKEGKSNGVAHSPEGYELWLEVNEGQATRKTNWREWDIQMNKWVTRAGSGVLSRGKVRPKAPGVNKAEVAVQAVVEVAHREIQAIASQGPAAPQAPQAPQAPAQSPGPSSRAQMAKLPTFDPTGSTATSGPLMRGDTGPFLPASSPSQSGTSPSKSPHKGVPATNKHKSTEALLGLGTESQGTRRPSVRLDGADAGRPASTSRSVSPNPRGP